MDGLPAVRDGGNVLLPRLAAKLSLRLAPTADPARAAGKLREVLEADPPYASRVRFETGMSASGWDAPPLAPWLADAARRASQAVYGHDAMYLGCGGSIPFIDMLGRRFPETQFLITGVLGPASNAHGPNEFLHLSYAQRLTTCVAGVLADHAAAASAR
jgi:acetylornithine deacetylase/succinyl-diaminopimelate desuccinylase-like protein